MEDKNQEEKHSEEFRKQKLTDLLAKFGLVDLELQIEGDLLVTQGHDDLSQNQDFRAFFHNLPREYGINRILHYFQCDGISSVCYADGRSDEERFMDIYNDPPDVSSD